MMKDIVAFDVETTGLNPKSDHIIQLSMIKLDSQSLAEKEVLSYYIRPEGDFEITSQAEEKNGLSKEFIMNNGVSLRDHGQEIIDFIQDCDILTYNGNSFDIGFLYYDLLEVGFDLDLNNRIFYDAFLLYKQLHPSTLEAVYKYYTGKELEGAHDALNDVRATIEVFKHIHTDEMVSREEMNEMEISKMLSPERSIKAVTEDNVIKEIRFNTGKHKDDEFMKVCKEDPTYIKWFMENVASEYTKRILRDYYKEHRD